MPLERMSLWSPQARAHLLADGHLCQAAGRALTESRTTAGPWQEDPNQDCAAYHTAAYRMYVMKVRAPVCMLQDAAATDLLSSVHLQVMPCFKRYCHDWTLCPFAHPGATGRLAGRVSLAGLPLSRQALSAGEKARRRDPRMFDYTGVACPDIKKVRSACLCCCVPVQGLWALRPVCCAVWQLPQGQCVPLRAHHF